MKSRGDMNYPPESLAQYKKRGWRRDSTSSKNKMTKDKMNQTLAKALMGSNYQMNNNGKHDKIFQTMTPIRFKSRKKFN